MNAITIPRAFREEWRWADLPALEAAAGAPARETGADIDAPFLNLDGPRLTFIDGQFEPAHSRPDTVAVERLSLGSDHPLANRATGEGWSLTLGDEHASRPVQIVHVSTGGENHVPARISLAKDAVAEVVETFVGHGWANRLTHIALGEGARLMRSVRLLQSDGFVSIRDEAEVGAAASLVSIFLGAGGMGSRIDGAIRVTGEGGFAEMGGALLTRGEQRQETAVALRHEAEYGTSKQIWRAVAADRSTASLAARVEVARGAQKTDGEQSLRGLLLKRTATINLKPELEIFADDVKCAHGATVGELDKRAMFYLQSRGIEEARATALLTRAFVADAIDRIGDETVRAAFAEDAERWFEGALQFPSRLREGSGEGVSNV